MDRDSVISRRAVEGMIAEGHTIVVFEGMVLKLDGWLNKHPGGRLAIMHMVGRDSTDEIKVYHSEATAKTMQAYRIGRICQHSGPWINMTPPIRGGVYRRLDDEIVPSVTVSGIASDDDQDDDSTIDDAASILPRSETSRSDTSLSELTSECSSVNGDDDKLEKVAAMQSMLRRRLPGQDAKHGADATVPVLLSRSEFTELAEQAEINQGRAEYPSLDPMVQQDIVRKYRLLHERVRAAGLYDCPYLKYGEEMVRYTTLFVLFLVALRYEWYITSSCFLGLFWHQIMFTAHDAGHGAITHNFVFDSLVGLFIADFCCGLSMGWWKSSHNVHHLITNHPEHDPDIQNVPLFATSPSFFKSLRSSYYDFTFVWDAAADFLVPFQKYMYFPVMAIARFNLYILSWAHVLSSRSTSMSRKNGNKAAWIRPTEIAFMSCYWFLFGYCLLWRGLPDWTTRVIFTLVSHIITMPLHLQINISHWGMSTSDLGEGESFPQRQLRTTMDVDCPVWLDWFHGGLQFQAVHHLFPRVPRHNLRTVQGMVKEFCAETGIKYSILGFTDGNKKVLGRLDEVGQQVRMLAECQADLAKRAVYDI